jgi:two-component system sensor histidine kinase KdpD
VVVGAPKRHGWRALFRPSTATELARRARGFDVITISEAEGPEVVSRVRAAKPEWARQSIRWRRYGASFAITLVCTGLASLMFPYFELANLVMIYLLGVAAAGLWLGRGPSVMAAVFNVAAFDFFFVPPRFTFAVSDVQYVVTFAVMLIIGLGIATLMGSVRQQTRVAGARERRTALLYAMSRELAAARSATEMTAAAIRHVAEVFDCEAIVLLPDAAGTLARPADLEGPDSYAASDLAVAQWVVDHGKRAGLGSDTLPAAPALYLPLGDEQRKLGVLAVLPRNKRRVLLPEQTHLLETFAGQIGIALERARLAEAAEAARIAVQGENLRNTLLASISHDLRTPLAVMAGAASTLQEHGASLDDATRHRLASSIEAKAHEMSDLVSNVLDLMRFESGKPTLRRAWETLDDLMAVALQRCDERLARHEVDVNIPHDLPAVFVDANLIVQVFVNLLENLVKYTPAGTRATIATIIDGDTVRVTFDDDGPGLPSGEPARLFDKFQRGSIEGTIAGVGLGLSICRAILRAHGTDIAAGTSPAGGARFEFTLPLKAPDT